MNLIEEAKALGFSDAAVISTDQLVFAWPESQIGMMDAKLAAKIMYADSDAATINEKAAEYAQLQSSALSAAFSLIVAASLSAYIIFAASFASIIPIWDSGQANTMSAPVDLLFIVR